MELISPNFAFVVICSRFSDAFNYRKRIMETGHAVECGLLTLIAIFFSNDYSVQKKVMLPGHICFSETFLKM